MYQYLCVPISGNTWCYPYLSHALEIPFFHALQAVTSLVFEPVAITVTEAQVPEVEVVIDLEPPRKRRRKVVERLESGEMIVHF